MKIPVGEIKCGRRTRKDMGDVEALAESIRDIGLLHPIVVSPDRRLLAGRRRLEAVKNHLKWETVPVTIAEESDGLE